MQDQERVKFLCQLNAQELSSREAAATDLRRGTLFVPTNAPPQAGTRVDLLLSIDETPAQSAEALVIWSRPESAQSPAGFGARILASNPQLLLNLESLAQRVIALAYDSGSASLGAVGMVEDRGEDEDPPGLQIRPGDHLLPENLLKERRRISSRKNVRDPIFADVFEFLSPALPNAEGDGAEPTLRHTPAPERSSFVRRIIRAPMGPAKSVEPDSGPEQSSPLAPDGMPTFYDTGQFELGFDPDTEALLPSLGFEDEQAAEARASDGYEESFESSSPPETSLKSEAPLSLDASLRALQDLQALEALQDLDLSAPAKAFEGETDEGRLDEFGSRADIESKQGSERGSEHDSELGIVEGDEGELECGSVDSDLSEFEGGSADGDLDEFYDGAVDGDLDEFERESADDDLNEFESESADSVAVGDPAHFESQPEDCSTDSAPLEIAPAEQVLAAALGLDPAPLPGPEDVEKLLDSLNQANGEKVILLEPEVSLNPELGRLALSGSFPGLEDLSHSTLLSLHSGDFSTLASLDSPLDPDDSPTPSEGSSQPWEYPEALFVDFSDPDDFFSEYSGWLERGLLRLLWNDKASPGTLLTLRLRLPASGGELEFEARMLRELSSEESPERGWLAEIVDPSGAVADRLGAAAFEVM